MIPFSLQPSNFLPSSNSVSPAPGSSLAISKGVLSNGRIQLRVPTSQKAQHEVIQNEVVWSHTPGYSKNRSKAAKLCLLTRFASIGLVVKSKRWRIWIFTITWLHTSHFSALLPVSECTQRSQVTGYSLLTKLAFTLEDLLCSTVRLQENHLHTV